MRSDLGKKEHNAAATEKRTTALLCEHDDRHWISFQSTLATSKEREFFFPFAIFDHVYDPDLCGF